MKTILYLIAAFLLPFCAFAQTPQAFSYQAIANNTNGTPVVNGSVAVRVSVLDGSATGTALYVERHTKTTNAQGLFSLSIGQGTVQTGVFSTLNWAQNAKFLKVELDAAGGTNYTTVGTNQLLSVPYALYASSAGNAGQWTVNANNRLAYNSGDVEIGQNGSGLWLTSPNGTKYKLSVNDNGTLNLPTAAAPNNIPAQLFMYGSFNNWDASTALQMTYFGDASQNRGFIGFKYLTAGTTYKFLPSQSNVTAYGAGTGGTLALGGNAFTVPSSGFYSIQAYWYNNATEMRLSVVQTGIATGVQIVSDIYNASNNTFTIVGDAVQGSTYFSLTGSPALYPVFTDILNDGSFEMTDQLNPNIPISAGTRTITITMGFNGYGTYTIN